MWYVYLSIRLVSWWCIPIWVLNAFNSECFSSFLCRIWWIHIFWIQLRVNVTLGLCPRSTAAQLMYWSLHETLIFFLKFTKITSNYEWNWNELIADRFRITMNHVDLLFSMSSYIFAFTTWLPTSGNVEVTSQMWTLVNGCYSSRTRKLLALNTTNFIIKFHVTPRHFIIVI